MYYLFKGIYKKFNKINKKNICSIRRKKNCFLKVWHLKKKKCLVASCNPKRIVKYWENICNIGPLDAFLFLVDSSKKKKYKRNIIKITIFCIWSNLNTIRLRHYLLFSPCKCTCLANFILHYKFISIFSIKSTFSISHHHSCVYLIV